MQITESSTEEITEVSQLVFKKLYVLQYLNYIHWSKVVHALINFLQKRI